MAPFASTTGAVTMGSPILAFQSMIPVEALIEQSDPAEVPTKTTSFESTVADALIDFQLLT